MEAIEAIRSEAFVLHKTKNHTHETPNVCIDLGEGDGRKLEETLCDDNSKHVCEFKITKAMVVIFGTSPGCIGCEGEVQQVAPR